MQGKKKKKKRPFGGHFAYFMSDTYKQHLTNKLHGFYPASCHTVSWNFLVIRGLCVLDGVSFILYLFIYLFRSHCGVISQDNFPLLLHRFFILLKLKNSTKELSNFQKWNDYPNTQKYICISQEKTTAQVTRWRKIPAHYISYTEKQVDRASCIHVITGNTCVAQ